MKRLYKPFQLSPINDAALDGDLALLISLHEQGCEMEMGWNEDTIAWTAYGGQIDCLQYLHENGCEWNEKTTNNAAVSGNLDCLQYALINGCPYNLKQMLSRLNPYSSCIDFEHKHSWLQDLLFPHTESDVMLRDLKYEFQEQITPIIRQTVATNLDNKLPLDVIKHCVLVYLNA